jgi:hypothetical protein
VCVNHLTIIGFKKLFIYCTLKNTKIGGKKNWLRKKVKIVKKQANALPSQSNIAAKYKSKDYLKSKSAKFSPFQRHYIVYIT